MGREKRVRGEGGKKIKREREREKGGVHGSGGGGGGRSRREGERDRKDYTLFKPPLPNDTKLGMELQSSKEIDRGTTVNRVPAAAGGPGARSRRTGRSAA